MSPRNVFVSALALIATAGSLIRFREPILLKLGLEAWEPGYYRAVDLAKSARSLQRHHTNYFTIQHRARLEGAAIDPDGWKAVRVDGDTFYVTYRAKAGERTVEYDFEVDVGLREVFVRCDDPGRPEAIPDEPTGREEPAPVEPQGEGEDDVEEPGVTAVAR